jgi:hypothetical protein
VHLGAQLPLLVRGIYYEGWHMAGKPTRERGGARLGGVPGVHELVQGTLDGGAVGLPARNRFLYSAL